MATKVFQTAEEEELAKKLGFKMPEKRASDKLPGDPSTYIVGYFNPNPWPVHIVISEVGFSLDLRNKNDFILVNGKKCNDPILEGYVGPGRLARETSKTKVPVIHLPRMVVSNAPRAAVLEAQSFTAGPDGSVQPVFKPTATIIPEGVDIPGLPSAGGFPVIGMTRELAEKLRLTRPTREIQESPVADNDGTPPSGRDVPYIEYAQDMTPGDVRRAQAAKDAATSTRQVVTTAPSDVPSEVVTSLPSPTEPEEIAISEAMKTAAQANIDVGDVAKLVSPSSVGVPSIPMPAEASPPTLPAEVVAAAPPGVSGGRPTPDGKFKCPLCDVPAQPFRSGLDRHVRFKHPEKYDEVMAKFPAKA